MKRNENNKSNRNRSLVVLLVLCAMLSVTLIGCKKPAAENPAPSTPTSEVESEVVSEEVSEPVSEEPSEEVVSEKVSEIPEIVDGVQKVYYETYDELLEHIGTIDSTVIVIFSFNYPEKGQTILYDGAHCTIEENLTIDVKSPKVITNITSEKDSVFVVDYDYEGIHEWNITLETTGTDIEVPLTITYEDGTEETFTVYITKDWQYSWEQ